MAKLSLDRRHWVLSLHITAAAIWVGAVISLLLVEWLNRGTKTAETLNALDRIINSIDHLLIIPSAISSVITATILCWGTNYGFTKFYWVITKWVLTVGLILFGSFFLDPWGVNAELISSTKGTLALSNSIYRFNVQGILWGGSTNLIFLVIIIFISVLKPWGRRNSA